MKPCRALRVVRADAVSNPAAAYQRELAELEKAELELRVGHAVISRRHRQRGQGACAARNRPRQPGHGMDSHSAAGSSRQRQHDQVQAP